MKVFLTFFILSVYLLSFAQAQPDRSTCCCGEGWVLAAPPALTIECLYQHDYFSFQASPEFTGYGAKLDACAFFGTTCSGCDDECDDDAFNGGPPNHLDEFDLAPSSFTVVENCLPDGYFSNSRTITNTFSESCFGTDYTTTQVVNIVDTIAPEVYIPLIESVECISTDGTPGSDVPVADFDEYFGAARATDLCTNPVWQTYTAAPNGALNPCNSEYTRTFVAHDGCQSTTRTQTVRFVDTTAPEIEVNALITDTCMSAIVITDPPTPPTVVRDACDNVVDPPALVSEITYPGKCTGDFTIERVWSAADTCGNTGYATQIIVIEDHDPPTITPDYTLYSVQDVNCNNIPAARVYTAVDECGGPTSISMEETTSGLTEHSERYDIIRTYKASDDCGNSVSWREVYVVDLGSFTTLSITNPTTNPYSTTRGTNIVLTYSLVGILCNRAYIVIDIGAATFVSATIGCTNGNGGPIYCPVGPLSGSVNFNVEIVVPTTYQPDTLQIRYSVAQTDPTVDWNFAGDHFFIIKLT